MLAQPGRVGATALHLDFLGTREQSFGRMRKPLHHARVETSLKQVDQRGDRLRALGLEPSPRRLRQRLDGNRNRVDLRAADNRLDLALLDLQVDDRAIAGVGAAARQAIGKIAVRFEIVAPGLAPDTRWPWLGRRWSPGRVRVLLSWPAFQRCLAALARRVATGTYGRKAAIAVAIDTSLTSIRRHDKNPFFVDC